MGLLPVLAYGTEKDLVVDSSKPHLKEKDNDTYSKYFH